jgi:hypothetical protein
LASLECSCGGKLKLDSALFGSKLPFSAGSTNFRSGPITTGRNINLFRTCKYRPEWPTKGFAAKADAQAWVQSFAGWYNSEHLHSAIRFVTPNARHAGHDHATLTNRANLYATAPVIPPFMGLFETRVTRPFGICSVS